MLGEADGAIAMGDFNAMAPGEGGQVGPGAGGSELPEDHAAAVHGGVVGAVLDAGFVDSYRLRHVPDGTDESTLLGRPGRRLDHIFVTSSLQPFVANSYIVDNEMVQVASDHRPVVTEFDFTAGDDAAHGPGAAAVRGFDGRVRQLGRSLFRTTSIRWHRWTGGRSGISPP